MKLELPIRITFVDPPPGVAYALQRGKSELVDRKRSGDEELSFELEITVDGQLKDGRPRFLGAFTQGPPDVRFFYVTIGTSAGDHFSPWTRRAKIPLGAITWEMIEEVQKSPGSKIFASFPGKAKDGGPSCATIRPLGDGWTVVSA